MTRYTVISHVVHAWRAVIALFTLATLFLFAVPKPLADFSPEMPMNAVVALLSSAVSPKTVTELPCAGFELRACLLSLLNDGMIALSESLALRCAITESHALSLLRFAITELLALRAVITEPLTLILLRSVIFESLALRSAITESLALSLLTAAKQSFAVSF